MNNWPTCDVWVINLVSFECNGNFGTRPEAVDFGDHDSWEKGRGRLRLGAIDGILSLSPCVLSSGK